MLRAVALAIVLAPAPAAAWELRGPDAAPLGREIAAAERFAPTTPTWASPTVVTDPAALAATAADALRYLRAHPDDPATAPGLFAELGVDRARIERTLERVVTVAAEDTAAGRASRLLDPAFLQAEFEVYRWAPDTAAARERNLSLTDGRIRLTRYFVPRVEGRAAPDEAHPVALYADPGAGLRERYTRAQVLDGAWATDPDGAAATPLVYLSRAVAHDAMMQGTVEVTVSGGAPLLLNVDQHNGHPYRPGVRSEDQERLWYFRVVERVSGWGRDGDKVALAHGASVAGDIYNVGLGKLVLVEHPGPSGTTLRLAVLGDTGGAFQPNLFQLDWLAGVFDDRAGLAAATADLPGQVTAGVLLLR